MWEMVKFWLAKAVSEILIISGVLALMLLLAWVARRKKN
jgi:LPXTG-motif cell wall-anchored protein